MLCLRCFVVVNFEAPGCEPPSPGVRRPLLCSAVCGKNAGRTDAGSGALHCACAGEGATWLIVVESGVGVGLGGFVFWLVKVP